MSGPANEREAAPASPAPAGPRPLRYLTSLDGLRCWAALAVILGHAGDLHQPSSRVLAQGGLLVVTFLYTFFITSGFLIYRPLLAQHFRPPKKRVKTEGSGSSYWQFILRRFLRIFPLYWTVLAVKCLYSGPGDISGVTAWIQLIFLLPFPNPEVLFRGGLGFAMWTLAIELPFYVLLPLFSAFTRKVGKGVMAGRSFLHVQLTCILGGMALMTVVAVVLKVPALLGVLALPMGMILATLEVDQWQHRRRFKAIAWVSDRWWIGFGLFIGLWQVGAAFAFDSGIGTDLDRINAAGLALSATLLVIGVLALFVTLCFGRPSPLSWALSSWPFRLLAPITYGTYLWHPFVLHDLDRRYGQGLWVLMGGTLFLSIAFAFATSFLVEAPVKRFRRKLDAQAIDPGVPRQQPPWTLPWLRDPDHPASPMATQKWR